MIETLTKEGWVPEVGAPVTKRITSEINRLETRLDKLRQVRLRLSQNSELSELLDLMAELGV